MKKWIESYFNFSIILREIDGGCCGAVTIIFVRLRVLGNILDAALGGHDDDRLEDGLDKAPEADRGLVRDPLAPSWSGIRDTVLSSDWLNHLKGIFHWVLLLWSN